MDDTWRQVPLATVVSGVSMHVRKVPPVRSIALYTPPSPSHRPSAYTTPAVSPVTDILVHSVDA